MGKPKRDIVGQVFERLTVLEEIPGKKGQPRMIRCQCQCGKVILANKAKVMSGNTRSCGCYRSRKYQELIVGHKFGKLLALELVSEKSPTGHTRYKVKCLCDCGNTSKPFAQSLVHGTATSCGCRRDQYEKITGERSHQFTGHKGISGSLWSHFIYQAKDRNLEFGIDIAYAWDLLEQQSNRCFFTGVPIVAYGPHITASLDRIDRTQGYVPGNVQWVHKIVNIMRNIYSVEQFTKVGLLMAQKRGWSPPNRKQALTYEL